MLHINNKYKPVISKTVKEQDYTSSVVPSSFSGKGLNELISKVKDLKVRVNHKKELPRRKYHLVRKNIILN